MSNDILKMFEGMNADQVKEFRRRVIPALEIVRAEILSTQTERNTSNMKTEQARKHLEKIKQDNQKRIDKLTAQIDARKEKGLEYADLEKQLDRVLTTSARSEELAERRLAEAEEADQEKASKEAADRSRIAADMDKERKTAAARVWVAQGGDPKEFETAWPTIREELIKNAVIQETNARGTRTNSVVGASL